MGKKKDKRIRKKAAYLQSFGSYTGEFFVSVNMTNKEILSWMERNNVRKDLIQEYLKNYDENWIDTGYNGLVCRLDDTFILWLKDWQTDNWEMFDTLMHEVHHLVQYHLHDDNMMQEEMEALAYQQEYLVKSIRNKLTDLFYGKG